LKWASSEKAGIFAFAFQSVAVPQTGVSRVWGDCGGTLLGGQAYVQAFQLRPGISAQTRLPEEPNCLQVTIIQQTLLGGLEPGD
jgi:hypothetical protein